uniref:hypothetical protein n=1 Tax=Methyloceanibacter sp. TaxID=1965321 RepID=UPI00356A4C35
MRLPHLIGLGTATALGFLTSLGFAYAQIGAEESCTDDAMIVFDASGSMSGNVMLGMATAITRIDEVRSALGKV